MVILDLGLLPNSQSTRYCWTEVQAWCEVMTLISLACFNPVQGFVRLRHRNLQIYSIPSPSCSNQPLLVSPSTQPFKISAGQLQLNTLARITYLMKDIW